MGGALNSGKIQAIGSEGRPSAEGGKGTALLAPGVCR